MRLALSRTPRIAERVPPERLIEQLSEYLLEMSSILREEHGTIDKFLGDGILAFVLFSGYRIPGEDGNLLISRGRVLMAKLNGECLNSQFVLPIPAQESS